MNNKSDMQLSLYCSWILHTVTDAAYYNIMLLEEG